MSKETDISYISFDEFVHNSGVKEATIMRRIKDIPGIETTPDGLRVMSGTRYPCDLHRYKLNNSHEKRYALLKSIYEFKYVTYKHLRVEQPQFEDMIRDLLSVGLIRKNNLSNTYGANAYDCTPLGDELMVKKDKEAKAELINMIASMSGRFTGEVISSLTA